MFRELLIIFCLVASVPDFLSQVQITKRPQHMQMFPRYNNDYGECVVEGIATKEVIIRSILTGHLSGAQQEIMNTLVKQGDPFRISHRIPSQLTEYDLTIFVAEKDSVWRQIDKIKNLVAGDFYIVSGQSNAECGFDSENEGRLHDSVYFQPANRAIGANIATAAQMMPDSMQLSPMKNDCRFGRPHSFFWNDSNYAYAGLWAVRLQYELAKLTGIPTCVVNGSRGASAIVDFYASHTPSDPDSLAHSPDYKLNKPYKLYDRVFKRLYENNATHGVKGVFWYQGETDASFDRDSAAGYASRFDKLYRSWLMDYPNIRNVIVLQLNMGCTHYNSSLVRELQRSFPQQFPKVIPMSTVGSTLSERKKDLCHYSVEGYSRIGEKLSLLSAKCFYDFPFSHSDVLPPNIQNIYYTAEKQITLQFDMDLIVEDSCWYNEYKQSLHLKDYFFDQDDARIDVRFMKVVKNKLVLQLSDSSKAITKVTYLPQAYSSIPSLYSGPWIRNAKNPKLAAYTFFEFPIQPNVRVSTPRRNSPLKVTPNPASDKILITQAENKAYTYELTDVAGKLILTGVISEKETGISVSDIERGVYLLKIREGNQVDVSKLLLH